MAAYDFKTSAKGQLSTLDLVVSTILFLIIVSSFYWIWAETNSSVWRFENDVEYKDKCNRALDILLKTSGRPEDWHQFENLSHENVGSIGLSNGMNEIMPEKLSAFGLIDYAESKRLMGLGSEDYLLEILDSDNLTIHSFGAERAAKTSYERMAILDGENVAFRLSLS